MCLSRHPIRTSGLPVADLGIQRGDNDPGCKGVVPARRCAAGSTNRVRKQPECRKRGAALALGALALTSGVIGTLTAPPPPPADLGAAH